MPITLRSDFDAPQLRALARKTKDGAQARRLLFLATIYEGASRTQAAAIGSVTVQIVRDWVVKFNAQGPAGLIDRKPWAAIASYGATPCGLGQSDRRWADPRD